MAYIFRECTHDAKYSRSNHRQAEPLMLALKVSKISSIGSNTPFWTVANPEGTGAGTMASA
jgi:hypothetical protein